MAARRDHREGTSHPHLRAVREGVVRLLGAAASRESGDRGARVQGDARREVISTAPLAHRASAIVTTPSPFLSSRFHPSSVPLNSSRLTLPSLFLSSTSRIVRSSGFGPMSSYFFVRSIIFS